MHPRHPTDRVGRPLNLVVRQHSWSFDVISSIDAATIVQTHLDRPDPYRADGLRFVVTRVVERPASWVVYYDSAAHIKSGKALDALAGNVPFVVLKTNGAFGPAGPARRLPEVIGEVEAQLTKGNDSGWT